MSRPNILFIVTDQQHYGMMSCTGNPWVRTPALDSLAEAGVRFDRTYCTNPVCVPSRFSLMTGRMPSAIGLRHNPSKDLPPVDPRIPAAGAGHWLAQAGYRCLFAGKQHFPKMSAEDLGFEVTCRDERDALAEHCAGFLRDPGAGPWFMVASFINPHDICHMAIRDYPKTEFHHILLRKCLTELAEMDEALKLPAGMDEEEFYANHCPPLPPNFGPQEDEPEALRLDLDTDSEYFRKRAREEWPPRRWRLHRWAYARLTERVDGQIGRVLDALRAGPCAADTIVIFTSDHGDMDASHGLEHKTVLYDNSTRVPLLVSGPGIAGGRVDRSLVSNGLDLLPTLCDYAGIAPPADLAGQSFRPLAEGRAHAGRAFVPIESLLGHAIVTERHKYMLYDRGASREQLFDLVGDPHETRNAARDAHQQAALQEHRRHFAAAFEHLAAAE